MINALCGMLAAAGYATLVLAYLSMRPKGVVSVIDMFLLLFSLQFGPHAILSHPFLESAHWVPEIYPNYAIGLALAYFSLAAGIFASGTILGINRLCLYPFRGQDLSAREIPVLICATLFYILFFVAYQGFDISRTISYLNFFQGNSLYTYTELRRELYNDDAGLGLAALTRQTTSALIFGTLIYASINFAAWRLQLLLLAVVLFIICCLQMNKFPVLYYALICGFVCYFERCYRTGRFISGPTLVKGAAALLLLLVGLYVLYGLQYGTEMESGLVDSERVLFRVISRPFAANHDVLYLWFATFPSVFDYIGFSNIPAFAEALGIEYFGPTVEVPALYVPVNTTFQAGFIGSAYASFGYPGIFFASLFVGTLVACLVRYEASLDQRWQRIVFLSVVGMNCYFLTSRELHTALQSGGLVLAPLAMVVFRTLSKRLSVYH